MIQQTLTRKQLLLELVAKYVGILLIFSGLYAPLSISPMLSISAETQESVISLMGFLMAAAIIGAFELSYSRTNLQDRTQRMLAHITKFTLYSSILLLNEIAILAIQVTQQSITGVMIMASMPIIFALVFYDFWDALRALDEYEKARDS